MRILLVNDDGILAPGLVALGRAVEGLGPVSVVAPDSPQSAAGRSITLHGPIRCERVMVEGKFWGIGVSGRPADCVKLAIRELTEQRPELVLSGINAGANVGVNIYYSGTVAAAAEGALFGLPAVAFSLAGGGEMNYQRAAGICRSVLQQLLAAGLGAGQLVNVNIPPLAAGVPRGIKLVPQSTAAISESYTRESDAGDKLTFRMTDHYEHGRAEYETDVSALEEGFVTITPLQPDLTDHQRLSQLQQHGWNGRLEEKG